MNANNKLDIRKLDLDQIKEFVISAGQPAFRAKQIYEWLWQKGETSFDGMSNLSKEFREILKNQF